MKQFIVFFLLSLFTTNIYAEYFELADGAFLEGEKIYTSESCVIVQTGGESNNPIVYWIISEIASEVLPDIAKTICIEIAGRENKEICDAIADGLDLFTSAVSTGKRAYKLMKGAVNYVAEKGVKKSGLYFITDALDLAYNVSNTIEAYDKLGYVDWQDVTSTQRVIQSTSYKNELSKMEWEKIQYTQQVIRRNRNVGDVIITNASDQYLVLYLSNDGVDWFKHSIPPSKSKRVKFWEGELKQEYGFIRNGNTCDYQVYTGKKYKFVYSNIMLDYRIEEIK